MAITGFYDGNVVRTPYKLEKGQKVLIIPISTKINQEKLKAYNSLKGILHSDVTLEEIREERLKRYM